MNPEIKQRWIDALRSDEYPQGMGSLYTEDGRYCCLGVLCELARQDGVARRILIDDVYRYGPEYGGDYSGTELPDVVREWAGLSKSDPEVKGHSLINWNDGCDSVFESVTFDEISNMIEEDL